MKKNKSNIAILGAGIAGIATAYYLSKYSEDFNIILIDKNQPLSFTTSKSGENFRDFWPQKCMRDLSIDSIHLMNALRTEYGETAFKMNFSGYNFVTTDKDALIFSTNLDKEETAFYTENTDKTSIKADYPYLSEAVESVVQIKNAGNIDVYAMGSLLLKEAKKKGTQQVQGEITGITKKEGSYFIELDKNKSIHVDKIVLAAGPFLNTIAQMLGLEFSIENTLQRKFIIPDPQKIIPRDMPFTIYADAQFLDWSEEEKAFFQLDPALNYLLEKFPAGLHIKPEGEGIKLGWAFNRQSETPTWHSSNYELFPQIVLKAASHFIPALKAYVHSIPTPIIEYAGYYTRTQENWPLIGPSADENVFVIGALSGFGTMTACAAAQLCTKYIVGNENLPTYAPYFHPNRYENAAIREAILAAGSDGQL